MKVFKHVSGNSFKLNEGLDPKFIQRRLDAIETDDNKVSLTITYRISTPGLEDSDSNTFSEVVGGRHDTTREQAIEGVIRSAVNWVESLRDQGLDVGAWDSQGNSY